MAESNTALQTKDFSIKINYKKKKKNSITRQSTLPGGNGSGFLRIWINYLNIDSCLDATARCSEDRAGGCVKPRAVRYDEPR